MLGLFVGWQLNGPMLIAGAVPWELWAFRSYGRRVERLRSTSSAAASRLRVNSTSRFESEYPDAARHPPVITCRHRKARGIVLFRTAIAFEAMYTISELHVG